MASEADREAFIPYRRADLVELCLEDGQLSAAASQTFRDFCFLLAAYYHFKFQSYLEGLKDNYAPFNPDAATRTRGELSPNQRAKKADNLVDDFKTILERANYLPIPLANLQKALEESSIVKLNTKVDFADFDQIVCHYQGSFQQTIQTRKFIRKVRKKISVFKRVVLLIKFKGKTHFANQGEEVDELKFTPGKTYLYFYKNVPRHDLELLFPNLKISMTWKDRIFLLVPAIGSAIPILLKVLPKLLIIIGAILFFTVGRPGLDAVGAEEDQVRNICQFWPPHPHWCFCWGDLPTSITANIKVSRSNFTKMSRTRCFSRTWPIMPVFFRPSSMRLKRKNAKKLFWSTITC